jgi:release factor glutamine methyltransferase
MAAPLTVRALLARATARVDRLDAELLLAHSLEITRTHVMTDPDHLACASQADQFGALIERRLAGEPLAYLLGYKEFWSLRLAVSPSVLVPRPETELLVERALALHPAPSAQVADLGTGSGAIAIALASERPNWRITATDVSLDALAVARENAAALNVRNVEFVAGHWFEPLTGRKFDLVVSNPPYIASSDAAMRTLAHEPRQALTPGADSMASLREIIHRASEYLEPDGWLLLEHGWDQANSVARELVGLGFRHVRCRRDLAGHERATEAQPPPK